MSSLNEAVVQPHFPSFPIETSIKDKNQQHHQRSLPKGQIAKVDISTAVNVPWRLYKLSTDITVSILAGSNTGSSGITSNLMRNKNQLLSYCVAALSYGHIYPERSWKPDDIDKIVDIGWNINRRALMKRPMNFEHQTDITDVFYIDSIKFVTLTKASIAHGILDKDDLASVNDFFNLLLENGTQSCVVEINKNYVSFWKSDDKYFIFQTMTFYQKSPKCIQFWSFECVKKYLEKMFMEVDAQVEYDFHSVDILKINNNAFSRVEILKNFCQDQSGKISKRNVNFPPGLVSLGLGNIPHRMCLMPSARDTIQTSYEQLSEGKDVLRCTKSIDRSAKISSTCVASIVVLHVDKASFWTSDTLSDILALGSKMYKENLKSKPKAQTEIRVADITQKAEFRSFQCLVESQQIIFGKVESTVANISNIEQGLTQFFMSHLAGVIDGPNVVAVWKENNYYYMYDAKPRNRFGRKLTKEENAAGESGMSCVTRFQQLIDLAEIYAVNVPHKERQDYYKITHIELKPFLGKPWNQWKVALPGQWCLRGQENLKPKDNLRVCVVALLYAEKISTKNWKQDIIDEIASTDSHCPDYSIRKSGLKELKLEIVMEEKTSFLTIKQKMFRYVVNELDKNIEDDLVKGFTMFFEENKHGIFSFNIKKNWKYFSVWKSSSNFFAFGLHVVCNEATGNEKKEILCALRFTSQIDMVKSLTANIIIRKNQEFSLSSVNLTEEDPKMDKKRMKNYKPLKVSKGSAGILRIGKNFDLIGSEEDDLKHSYNIASVIAMTLIKDCWSWSNYDVWDILKISQKSFSAHFKELDNFCIKIGSTTIKIKDMETFSFEKEQSEVAIEAEKAISNDTEKSRLVFEDFMKTFEKHNYPNGVLKSNHLQLALWKKDGAFFVFNLRDADETGVITNQQPAKSTCPYVAFFDSMNALLDHIWLNLCEAGHGSYELISFKLKAKVENANHKTWYNFTPVSDISNQWMIRSLYGSLQYQYGISSCVIALAFASTLQPSNWNSSMLDSVLKYGIKLYKKSLKTNSTEIKLNSIVTPFIIGCYEFSYTAALLKCGANEPNVFENGIVSLFNHADFGVISSKGYSAAIWQQNSSYFIFDPQLNGMASLSRFSNIALISNHFLSHVRTGMTGVNVFEIYKISISRNIVKKKDCSVDIEAISKLTNRPMPINDTTDNNARIFDVQSPVLGENIPTECVLVAACVLGVFKNPEYWTSNSTEDIRNLGTNIFQSTVKKLNLVDQKSKVSIQPDQMHGVYSFDTRSAIRIRTEEFHFDTATAKKDIKVEATDTAATEPPVVNDDLKAILLKFFELYDNAFFSTTNAALTAWKQGGRFYLFCCQPVDIDEHLTNVGEPKGVLLTFLNLDELHSFLKTNFGGGSDSKDWLKIRFLEIDFVPLEDCSANEQSFLVNDIKDVEEVKDVTLANTKNSRLSGPLCQCSSSEAEHLEKHVALCLAAIIMSTIHEIKTWTEKSLSQIEIIGNVLYDDAVMQSHCKQVEFAKLPLQLYIEHVEYLCSVSDNKTDRDMDEPTLTGVIKNEFEKNSSTLYVLIGTHSFSLIEQDKIYYWYDPSGVDDENKEIRSSVCCFSNIQLLVTHILELNNILSNAEFQIEFVNCKQI